MNDDTALATRTPEERAAFLQTVAIYDAMENAVTVQKLSKQIADLVKQKRRIQKKIEVRQAKILALSVKPNGGA